MSNENSSRLSENRKTILFTWAGVIAALLVHGYCVLKELGGLARLFSKEPMIYMDHGWHFYYGMTASRTFLEHGVFWTYDPYFMAGYATDFMDMSDRLIKLLMAFINWPSHEASYKILVFLTAAVAPPLFYAAARLFDFDRKKSLLVCVTGTWLWLVVGMLFYRMGMTGFTLACVYGITFSGVFYRFLKSSALRYKAGLLLGGPLALLIHPGILPIIGVCAVPLYVLYFRRLSLSGHLFVAAVCLVSVLANFFWIMPYFVNAMFAIVPDKHFQNPVVLVPYLIEFVTKHYQLFLLLVPWAAIEGLRSLYARGQKDLVLMMSVSVLVFLFITLFGTHLPLFNKIEPVRYVMPATFFLVLPLCPGLFSFASKARDMTKSGKYRAFYTAPLLIFVSSLLAFVVGYVQKPVNKSYVGLNEPTSVVMSWIAEKTDGTARVMVEDHSPITKPYGKLFPLAPIAYYTGRELVGGPHYGAYFKTHFVDISGTVILGRFYHEWDRESLARAMDTYNVGWVIVHAPWLRRLFNKYPDLFEPLETKKGFVFYKVRRDHSFVLEGSGRVEADYNNIHITGIKEGEENLVIAYHWHPLLECAPPCEIYKVRRGEDPVAFIGVKDPGEEVLIKVRYFYYLK